MERFSGLAAIFRAIEGGATATVASASTTTNNRFLQAALYSSSFSSAKSRWISHHEIVKHSTLSAAHVVAGTMFFSAAAASSLAEDVHAKELPPSKKFLPNDVVLYQYEACPFCNKVKGILSSSIPTLVESFELGFLFCFSDSQKNEVAIEES
ncbi:glutathione S-transferase family protein [Actinidia rufa]|uniref:Glutathione S-transferase family protein n=1 Tax=Actinidia rufa TaxID=165716 RepID=A0A7J0EIZ8_9ERIC|nr:glutathione S-transferase family protein [Actinidia rufa]